MDFMRKYEKECMQETLQSIIEVIPERIAVVDSKGNEILKNQAMIEKVTRGAKVGKLKVKVIDSERESEDVSISQVMNLDKHRDGTQVEFDSPDRRIKMTVRKRNTMWMGKAAKLSMFVDNTKARQAEEAIA